jgi:ribosome-associated toxin RatA of RatAB toxin-antitoxin module
MALSGAQEFTTEVHASVQQCFAAITDFEQYPKWFSGITGATVIERYRNGLGKVVDFRMNMKLKSVRYVLQYEYDKPTQLTWRAVDGDIESVEGVYRFEKLGPKLTSATCRQAISLGFWIPGPLRGLFERQALKQSVLEFKAAAENR